MHASGKNRRVQDGESDESDGQTEEADGERHVQLLKKGGIDVRSCSPAISELRRFHTQMNTRFKRGFAAASDRERKALSQALVGGSARRETRGKRPEGAGGEG